MIVKAGGVQSEIARQGFLQVAKRHCYASSNWSVVNNRSSRHDNAQGCMHTCLPL